jgi:hypothetical protein
VRDASGESDELVEEQLDVVGNGTGVHLARHVDRRGVELPEDGGAVTGLRICLARTSRSAGGASVSVKVAPTAMACMSRSCCLTSSSSRPVAAAIAGGQIR